MTEHLDSAERPIVIVSNRGPLSFRIEGGELLARRGAGGMVSGLAPLVVNSDTTWIAAAISDGDRVAAGKGVIEEEGFRVRTLALDAETYRLAYDVVSNSTLWFIHHSLYDLASQPRFDDAWREAWQAYVEVNEAFAEVVATDSPPDAIVLIQDYHLMLLAPRLRDLRPDLRLVHFSHTPFADPDMFRVLPVDVRTTLLEGMAAHDACGFHCQRWADAFTRCARELAGVEVPAFVAPLAPDAGDIGGVAARPACDDAFAELDELIGDRLFLVRVDRIELSKNLLRGFLAFETLLEDRPEWAERVVFGAFCYPSRQGVPEYHAYAQQVEAAIARINDRFSTDSWTPILYEGTDDFPRSVAALRRYDVLLVNPIRDGLNLVAKEGPLVNERNGLVALSPEAGVWPELAGAVREVHPYDIEGTAQVLHDALTTDADTRRNEAAELLRRARERSPADWLRDQIAAIG